MKLESLRRPIGSKGPAQRQAEALKKGEAQAGTSLQEILPILRSVSDDLGQELQKTFDFFIATTSCCPGHAE